MEAGWRHSLDDAESARLAGEIDQQGYGVISDYVSASEIERARALAVAAVDAAGGEYACFTGPDALGGTVLSELPQSPAFKNLCRRLYELSTGRDAPDVEFYQIFRCLQGSGGQQHSYRFHYDSYILTALLPIAIPETGARGDLIIVPKLRPVRRSYLMNVVDKVLIHNGPAQRRLRKRLRDKSSTVAIQMKPGNLYFFWGYRTIHTNEPCDPDKLRATALFHYGDPHQNSRARGLVRRVAESATRLRG